MPADAWIVLFVGSGFERKGLDCHRGASRASADRTAGWSWPARGPRRTAPAASLGVRRASIWLRAAADVERLYAAADVVALPRATSRSATCTWRRSPAACRCSASARAGGAEMRRSARTAPWPRPRRCGSARRGAASASRAAGRRRRSRRPRARRRPRSPTPPRSAAFDGAPPGAGSQTLIFIDQSGDGLTLSHGLLGPPCSSTATAASRRKWATSTTRQPDPPPAAHRGRRSAGSTRPASPR